MGMLQDLILVHPPQRGLLNGFPNGIVALANFIALREPDAVIAMVDLATAKSEQLGDIVRRELAGKRSRPIIGISTTTASYRAALEVAAAFRAVAADAMIVMGGHHASPQHEVILRRHPNVVDVVVRGEGEYPLLELVRGADPWQVPGCSSLRDGKVHANPLPEPLSQAELDAIPLGVSQALQGSTSGKFDHYTYVSARGCPLRCAFCAVAGQTVRSKSVDRVIADLRTLVEGCGEYSISIEDNFFAQNKVRTISLLKEVALLQRKLERPFRWDCQTRVESMASADVQNIFADALCESVYLGVESFSVQELLYLKKSANPERYVDLAFKVCSDLLRQPYNTFINIQVGLPGEDDGMRENRYAHLYKLGQVAESLGRQITIFPQLSVVYPGTAHFANALRQGTFGPAGDEVFELFCEWETHEESICRFLGENFAHGLGGIPLGILDTEQLRSDSMFSVIDDEVARLRAHIERLAGIPGIKIFRFSEHLTPLNMGSECQI